MKTRTNIEKQVVELIAQMWYEGYFIIETEIARSGETLFILEKGREFEAEACKVFFKFISKNCKQFSEIKTQNFHHIIWNFENICIMFWDCD